jgi:site-specific DNA-methyltransferase (adenine-specific)
MSIPVNTVYEGDVFDLLRMLPDYSVDMVFSDPDYNMGIRYNGRRYRKAWDDYIDWYIRLARESLRVLKDDGNAFFLNMPKQNAYLRVRYLDDACYDVHEYAWLYTTPLPSSPYRFRTAHRTILHARKQKRTRWYKHAVALPYRRHNDKGIQRALAEGSSGRMPDDWFYFDVVTAGSREKTIHPCQVPRRLFELLLRASTQEGDLVLVLFGGAGSEVAVCHEMNRRWLTAEIDPVYADLIRKRIALGRIPDEYRWRPKSKIQR